MGVCAAGIPGPDEPEIHVDNEQLKGLIKTEIEQIQDKVRENCERFPNEIAEAAPHPYIVPETTIKLIKDTPDQDIAMAAIFSAFGKTTRDQIKENIWKRLERDIDEQLNEHDETSEKTKQNAKKKFKQNTVDKAIDTAMDDALDKMK